MSEEDEQVRNSPQEVIAHWFTCHWCNAKVRLDEILGVMVDHGSAMDYPCRGSGKFPHV